MADVTKTAGRYQLQEELGRGAMGIVYKAFDPTIGRTVAVKTMRLTEAVTGMSHDELIARFQVETRAAGLLTHPNIVVVYDAGEDHGIFYITMEFVQGRSLQALIDQKQVFPLPRVMRIIEQAGSALDFAHQNSVVHRDIKPANLMLTGDDTVKVTDFGTAKILQKGATQTGAILGTPSYMSPEQVKGKPVDGRSDIFSLGVILYELVTGEKPFPGQNVTTVIYKIVNEEPIPPRELDTSIHPGLNYVISKALSKDSEERYQNCKELVEELKSYKELGGVSESATIVMPGRARPQAVLDAIARAQASSGATPATRSGSGQVIPPPAVPPDSTVAVSAPRYAPKPATLPPLTGSLMREPEPEKKHSNGLWIGLLLLVIVVAGGYIVWPTLNETLLGGKFGPVPQPSSPGATAPAKEAVSEAAKPAAEPAKETAAEPAATDSASERVRSDFEKYVAKSGLQEKVRVEVVGNAINLYGALTPDEHKKLAGPKGRAPRNMRLNDRTTVAAASKGPAAKETKSGATPAGGDSEKPRTSPGKGEVEVLTDQLGAMAVIKGPSGYSEACKTPCRFEDLAPGRYTMQITKDGFRPVNRIVNVKAGNISKENIPLQSFASGLIVTSQPSKADVYINGQKHAEQTPTTIRLAPGTYTVTVQKPGYEKYTGNVELKGDALQQFTVGLTAAQTQAPATRGTGVGYLEIRTIPPGADILINNTNSGRKTPSRLELPPGKYSVTLYLKGYQVLRKDIEVEDGRSLPLNETLKPQ